MLVHISSFCQAISVPTPLSPTFSHYPLAYYLLTANLIPITFLPYVTLYDVMLYY